MRYQLLTLLLFCYVFSYGQDDEPKLNDFVTKAREALKDSNDLDALRNYHKVYMHDYRKLKKSEAGDQIEWILFRYHEAEFKKMRGTWIFNSEISNYPKHEKIIIESREIEFYKKKDDTLYDRKEFRIVPDPEDINGFGDNMITLKFSTGDIWEFKMKNDGKNDLLFTKRTRTNDGHFVSYSMDPLIFKSENERKEYYVKERRPHYIRVSE
ncbi:hypothetical protein [Nonlabens ponticola]|uniref:Uncharacterized protein n=1 Tax=Nonlabens ponticola TaxID=2496866 RepID=A0A3S9MYH5_9FLAO|nr:hypothetical protein [Nonlabens ponticola]AZQ44202.1 hypothetical protein EJ995_08130 [Nonlabens ponticola]